MAKLVWDQIGEHFYETGTRKGVLFVTKSDNTYGEGVAWSGITAVSESPEGADVSDFYADDIKYASIRSAETFSATIEAYTYPPEFMECDGSASPIPGVYLGQQGRKAFGFSYVSQIGNDLSDELGYKIHLIYGCTASPSERSYQTINDSPDIVSFSWDIDSTPVNVDGYKAVSSVTIDSTKVDKTKLAAFEEILYGSSETPSRLPMPNEVITLLTASV